MGNNTPARRPRYTPSQAAAPSRSVLRRSQSPEEAMADMYVSLARVHAIKGVSLYGADTIGAVDRRRKELVEELPEANELLWGLEVNAARLIASIQNSLTNDHRDVIA